MRAAQKYEPKNGGLKAASTCRARSWGPGTRLRSAEWFCDRVIHKFDPKPTSEFVVLKGVIRGHHRIMLLPSDVHEVELNDAE